MIEDSCPLSQSAAVDLSGGVSVSAGLLCISGIIPRILDIVAGCARPFRTIAKLAREVYKDKVLQR